MWLVFYQQHIQMLNAPQIVATKTTRKNIQEMYDSVDSTCGTSREASLAKTKLEEASMWFGKHLAKLGADNPYRNSKDPSNTIVDPTAPEAIK